MTNTSGSWERGGVFFFFLGGGKAGVGYKQFCYYYLKLYTVHSSTLGRNNDLYASASLLRRKARAFKLVKKGRTSRTIHKLGVTLNYVKHFAPSTFVEEGPSSSERKFRGGGGGVMILYYYYEGGFRFRGCVSY